MSKICRVLFIGNSYTYYNDMPTAIFERLAASLGYEMEVTSITKGGYQLYRHADPADECGARVAAALSGKEPYDFVILQEQSVRPAGENAADFYASVRDLAARIRQTGAKPVLYATWGYFDLCYGEFRFFPVDYIGVALLALLLLVVGIYLGRPEWKIFNIVNNIGNYSSWVICIHSIEQKCIPWKMLIKATESFPNVGFILTLIIKAIIIMAVCKLLKRLNKMKYRKRKKALCAK